MQTVVSEIASAFDAMERSKTKPEWAEWEEKHRERIESLCVNHLPHGSGFDDGGVKFDFDASKPNRLVFYTSYHHMNEGGYYDGWTDHMIIVKPDLALGFDLRVTGRDRNDIKDYIGEVVQSALSTPLKCYGQCRLWNETYRFLNKLSGYSDLKSAFADNSY